MPQTLQDIIDANPEAETFRYGNTPELCEKILGLVRAGKKTATCEAMRVYEDSKDRLPEVGRRDIALHWNGKPALVVETVEVFERRFNKVDAEFVRQMGEFRDLAHWQDTYRAYFEATGGFDTRMRLMCERFRMVEDYDTAPPLDLGPETDDEDPA